MIPGRLSHWREFNPVPSLSSEFVYMISPKKVMLARLRPARVHLGCCTRVKNSVPARNLATVSCKRETTTRSGVKSASRWAGTGSTCVHFLIDTIFAIWIHACIRPCHTAAILSRKTKKALFYHAKPHPHGFHCEAWRGKTKLFLGPPGQYGRRVTRANFVDMMVSLQVNTKRIHHVIMRYQEVTPL